MPRPRSFIISCFLALAAGLASQVSAQAPSPAGTGAPPPPEEDLVRDTLALDIESSTFYELAAWCRRLGLPDTGEAAELRSRLYAALGVEAPPKPGRAERTILVERAGSAEFEELEDFEGNLVRLSGGVRLRLEEGGEGALHEIEAREIVYDRERDSLTARGGVEYRRSRAGAEERFSGELLSVDLGDWSGLFLDGSFRKEGAELASGERGLVFSGEAIRKGPGPVLSLARASLSACGEAEPHYSLRADRMWLLGDNEWAFRGALLSVGEVPVFWLPFLYYPGDEFLLHPVFGYRAREGSYVQTTTYLLGQKAQAKEGTGILRIKETPGRKELSGLFLRKVEGSVPPPALPALKVFADAYANLGLFAGLQGSFPKAGNVEKSELFAGLALSRSVFSVSSAGVSYSPYASAGDFESVWNQARLGGLVLPARFGLETSLGAAFGPFSASLELPFYSDPSFTADFRDRSEDMNWLELAKNPSSTSSSATKVAKKTSLLQRLSLGGSLPADKLGPFIGAFELQRSTISLSWLSKTRAMEAGESAALFAADPGREFFYPDTMKPFEGGLSLRGTLFTYPSTSRGAESPPTGESPAGPLLRAPWFEEAAEAPGSGEEGTQGAVAGGPVGEFRLPKAAVSSFRFQDRQALGLVVDWSLLPSLAFERRWLAEASGSSPGWRKPEDIDLSDILYDLRSSRLTANLGARGSLFADYLTAALGLGFLAQDQSREIPEGLRSDPLFASRLSAYALADAQYRQSRLSGTAKLEAKPFAEDWLLSATSLAYAVEGVLYGSDFDKMVGQEPTYKTTTLAWNRDSIRSHSLTARLGLALAGKTQTLSLGASLPPLAESYSGSLALDLPLGPLGLTGGAQGKIARPKPEAGFAWDPLSLNLGLKAPFDLSLSGRLSYDLEASRLVSAQAVFGFGTFSSTLGFKRGKLSAPDPGRGWIQVGEEEFRPSDLNLSYKRDLELASLEAGRLDLQLSGSYSQSFLRFTDSSLNLGLGLELKLGAAMTLSFSSQSQNLEAWRYWPWLFADTVPDYATDPGRYRLDPLADILASFGLAIGEGGLRFSEAARRLSAFKLRGLSLKLSRDLHDWDLSLSVAAAPKLDQAAKKYYLDASLSFSLVWRDIPEVKAEAKYAEKSLSW